MIISSKSLFILIGVISIFIGKNKVDGIHCGELLQPFCKGKGSCNTFCNNCDGGCGKPFYLKLFIY
jgi:hypothetical protein